MSKEGGHRTVSIIQVAAAAAAAATAAVAASVLGVAGTVVGAALVSATITVLAAVYDHSLRTAREKVRTVRPASPPSSYAPAAEPTSVVSDDAPTLVMEPLHLEDETGYHWGRIVLATLLLFALAMSAITVFEVASGQPVSCLIRGDICTDRTSVQKLTGGRGRSNKSESPSPTVTVTKTTTSPPPTTASPTPTETVTVTATPTTPAATGASSTPTGRQTKTSTTKP